MTYELIAYNTDSRYDDVRHREYTTSEKTANLFQQIPKIQFTDSGHGIVFVSREMEHGQKRKMRITTLWDYVEKNMKILKDANKPPKRKSKKDIRIEELETTIKHLSDKIVEKHNRILELETKLDERFKLYEQYRKENIELRKDIRKLKYERKS